MATSFSRSLRSLEADRFTGSLIGMGVGLVLLAAWLAWFFFARVALYEVSDVARLETGAEPHQIMSLIDGRVIRNDMELGRDVAASEVLLTLDDRETRLELEEIEAEVRGHRGQLASIELEIAAERRALEESERAVTSALAEARARHQEAEAAREFAAREASRKQTLVEDGLLSRAEAESSAAVARQRDEAAQAFALNVELSERERQAELAEKRAELENLERQFSEVEARIDSLGAVRERLEHALSLHQLRAPVAGRIGDLAIVKTMEVVSAGQHLGTIIPAGDVRVVAEFAPHRALGRIREGQSAKLRLEGFSWVQYGAVPATVTRVGSEPSGGTVRVELALDDPDSFSVDLGHGLPGVLEVEVERISPAALVLRAAGNRLTAPASPSATSSP